MSSINSIILCSTCTVIDSLGCWGQWSLMFDHSLATFFTHSCNCRWLGLDLLNLLLTNFCTSTLIWQISWTHAYISMYIFMIELNYQTSHEMKSSTTKSSNIQWSIPSNHQGIFTKFPNALPSRLISMRHSSHGRGTQSCDCYALRGLTGCYQDFAGTVRPFFVVPWRFETPVNMYSMFL